MAITKSKQQRVKMELDEKLRLSRPSRQLLDDLAIEVARSQTPDQLFQYAFCLSKSQEKAELRYAVSLLDKLIKDGYQHQFDCMYGAATALYLAGEYQQARDRCEAMLRSKPESDIAGELHLACIESQKQLEKTQSKQVATGTAVLAIVGVAAALAGTLLAAPKK